MLEKGDRVNIFNTVSEDGIPKQILEGVATIMDTTDVRDWYVVLFDGDDPDDLINRFVQEENLVSKGGPPEDTDAGKRAKEDALLRRKGY